MGLLPLAPEASASASSATSAHEAQKNCRQEHTVYPEPKRIVGTRRSHVAKRRLLKFFAALVVIFVVVGFVCHHRGLDARRARTSGARSLDARPARRRHAGRNAAGRRVRAGHRRHARADRARLRRCAAPRQDRCAYRLRCSSCPRISTLPTGERCRKCATRSSISGNPASASTRISNTAAIASTTWPRRPIASYMVPSSPLDVKGLASYEVFLRGTLDKIGAQGRFRAHRRIQDRAEPADPARPSRPPTAR